MKFTQFLSKAKDGGSKSPVDGYFLFEIKDLCSIALLKFNEGTREEFHTHAFNALTWFIKGDLIEEDVDGSLLKYQRSIFPKITLREKNHRVIAKKNSWCFTVRGKWVDKWAEFNKETGKVTVLTHGRKIVNEV